VTITLAGGGTFLADAGTISTLGGQISGPGSLTKAGSGTLTLTGANIYMGGTNLNGGILAVNSDANLGSGPLSFDGGTLEALAAGGGIVSPITVTITLNPGGGTFLADAGTLSSLNGPISGIGSFTKDGTGTLTLAGTNIYSGATNVVLGTLKAGSPNAFSPNSAFVVAATLDLNGFSNTIGSLAGNGIVTNMGATPATLTAGGNNASSTFSGTVDDGISTVQLTKTGTGTLTLSGKNSYSGGTDLNGGILAVNSDTNLGTGLLRFDGGTLEALTADGGINSAKAITLNAGGGTFLADTGTISRLSGSISGVGSLTKAGIGTLVLTGVNNYSGGTNFNGGILAVNSDANLGTGPLSFNGGTLEALTAGGGISSAKAVTLNAGGGTFLADTGTTSRLSGPISGIGSLTKAGIGTLVLTGVNSYSGGTNFNGGIVAVNSDANLGTGPLSFNGGTLEALTAGGGISSAKAVTLNAGGGTFQADAGTTSRLSGPISGIGSLTKAGIGTLVLTGANTYSGGTVLDDGILMVGSPHALGTGNMSVNGGVLTTDPQAINVGGNYAQSGGTLLLHAGGASVGQYDSLNVGGRASLGGTLQVVALNGFQLMKGNQLILVTANGGIQGRFATFIDPFTSNTVLQPGLVYQPNDVILELLFTSFVPSALTPNQRTVAGTLDNVVFDSRAATLIDFLTSEPVSSLPGDFDRIAPADLTSLYEVSFSGANIQRFNLINRMAEIREGSTGFSSQLSVRGNPLPMGKDGKGIGEEKSVMQPSPENKWGIFVSGDGDFVNVEGDGNGAGYDFTTGGVTIGMDCRVARNLAIGLMGGYAHTWADLVRNGRISVNSGKGGLYTTWWNNAFYVNGFVGGGYNSYETNRGGLRGSATGTTDGGEFEIFGDAGYDAKVGDWSFGPFATLAYTYVSLNSFTEHGSLAPLDIVYQNQDSLRTDLGLRAEYRIKAGGVELRPHVRAAWEHEYFYSALPIDARLANGAGDIFTVFGPSEGHDSLIINAGVSAKLTENLLLYIDYDAQVGRDHYASQAVVGGLRWSF
jgi:autotransporter-associated beta strand protein